MEEAFTAVTRAQAKQKKNEESAAKEKEKDSGVACRNLLKMPVMQDPVEEEIQVSSPEDDVAEEKADLEQEDIPTQGNEVEMTTNLEDESLGGADGKELRKLQWEDETLKAIRESAKQPSKGGNYWFYEEDGLLYRHWHPREEGEEFGIEQLIVPKQHRATVLQVAHEIPLAGHMGKKKTIDRIMQRFYWPTLYRDVAEWCRRCEQCQKYSPIKNFRAPLVPLPVIEEPFGRIAMDVVGPLPRSGSGNKYVYL